MGSHFLDTDAADGGGYIAAAIEPARWPEALRRLARATGSDHGQLIGFGPQFGIGFNWVSDMPDPVRTAFDPVPPDDNFRVVATRRFPDMAILHERHYAEVRRERPANGYDELCRIWGIEHGCQTDIRRQADGLIGLAVLRSRSTGPTDAAARAAFDRGRVEIAAAVALQIALEQEGYRLIAGTFEAMASACFVLDRTMRIGAMTPAAEAMLSRGEMLLADRRPAAVAGAGGARLERALAECAAGDARSRRIVLIPGMDSQAAIGLQLHRLPQRDWSLGFAPYAILVATTPGAARGTQSAGLEEAFGLTASEAVIAQALADGAGRDAVCVARGISRETLRSHLRAIFAKLGVHREAELVQLIGRIGG